LRLHLEEFPEQNPMGLDPQERFTEVNEDCGMENTVRVLASIYKSKRPSNGQMDKSALG
jgi:hypothetical protein